MNRFVWNMRYPDAVSVPGAVLWGGATVGPTAPPGTYEVRLTAGGKTLSQKWNWLKDPRLATTQEDLEEQFGLLILIRDKLSEVNRGIIRLRSARAQVDSVLSKAVAHDRGKEIAAAAGKIKEGLAAVEDVLIQSKSKSRQDPLNYPILLDNKLAALAMVVASADARPTDQSIELFEDLATKADAELARLQSLLEGGVAAFNALVREAGIPAVVIK